MAVEAGLGQAMMVWRLKSLQAFQHLKGLMAYFGFDGEEEDAGGGDERAG